MKQTSAIDNTHETGWGAPRDVLICLHYRLYFKVDCTSAGDENNYFEVHNCTLHYADQEVRTHYQKYVQLNKAMAGGGGLRRMC